MTLAVADSPGARRQDQWVATILDASGAEMEQVTLTWVMEHQVLTRKDGTSHHRTDQWPEGFERHPHRIGAEHGASCALWRSLEVSDPRVIVQMDIGSGQFDHFVCPTIRVAMALVREWLPIASFEMGFEVFDHLSDHLYGTCQRRGCAICSFIGRR